MTKAEFILEIAQRTKMSKTAAAQLVQTTLDLISENLGKGEEVVFPGFGKFLVSERSARKGRNPQTGKEIEIKASKAPRFKAGKLLKEAVQ